jgi:hypothetical protein
VRDGLGVQRVGDNDSSFEYLAELVSSLRRERVEVSRNWGRRKRGAKLGGALEAQGKCMPGDSDLVESRVLQQLPKLTGVWHSPRARSVAIREFVAGHFSDGGFEGCECR